GSFVVPLPGRPAGKTPRAGALRHSSRRHRSRSRAPVEDGAMISTADARSDVHPRDGDGLPTPLRTRRRLFGIVAGAIFTPVVFAAMWPVTFDSREELFEIPKG